ncbi:MAG: sulfurtransferase complex subunit TusB, partial [Candidatus Thorarchaeota archaeon]
NDEIGLLLLQDGVYLADMGCTHGHDLIRSGLKTYASEKHVEERGLRSRIDKSVNVVGYPDIIDLMMEKYDKVISL